MSKHGALNEVCISAVSALSKAVIRSSFLELIVARYALHAFLVAYARLMSFGEAAGLRADLSATHIGSRLSVSRLIKTGHPQS